MQPEAKFRARFTSKLRELGWFCQSIEAGGGVPDYYIERPGEAAWIEFKVAPNYPSKKQFDWIDRATENGQTVYLITYYPTSGRVRINTETFDNEKEALCIFQR